MKRIMEVVFSERFIQLLVIAVLQSLVLFNVITSEQGTGLINILSGLLGASVFIRTADKHAEIKANATSSTTTVTMPNTVSTVTASQE